MVLIIMQLNKYIVISVEYSKGQNQFYVQLLVRNFIWRSTGLHPWSTILQYISFGSIHVL